MIYKGLDEDEAEFLEKIAADAEQEDANRWIEAVNEIKKFKISVQRPQHPHPQPPFSFHEHTN